MKIIGNTLELAKAAENCRKAASTKNTVPAIAGILFSTEGSEIHLTGYDCEFGITTSVPVRIEEEGRIVIDKTICEILKKLPGSNVSIETTANNMVTIKSGDMQYNLVGINADDYPEYPKFNASNNVTFPGVMFCSMIRHTIYAVSTDDRKPVHTGIRFEITKNNLNMIAVDGYRLAICREPVSYTGDAASFVVPAKALNEASRLIGSEDVSLDIGVRHIVINTGKYSLFSRLLDGEFLNYKAAIPKDYQTEVKVSIKPLMDCIDRVAVIISDKLKAPVIAKFADGQVNMSVKTSIGSARDTVSAEMTGAQTTIGLNSKFLIDALRACNSDEIVIRMNGSAAPMLIENPNGNGFTQLILPIRTREVEA